MNENLIFNWFTFQSVSFSRIHNTTNRENSFARCRGCWYTQPQSRTLSYIGLFIIFPRISSANKSISLAFVCRDGSFNFPGVLWAKSIKSCSSLSSEIENGLNELDVQLATIRLKRFWTSFDASFIFFTSFLKKRFYFGKRCSLFVLLVLYSWIKSWWMFLTWRSCAFEFFELLVIVFL